ncbi:MAG: serine protease [Puia sp.]|nr:serine protease [Puia sp.]
MKENNMMDSIERYIRGEMLPEERVFFEQLRKTNPGVDQLVVEHTLFLHQLNKYGERKDFTAQLHEIHKELLESGELKEAPAKGKVIQLWNKYKRVVMVAASIAGITALAISGLVSYVSPKATSDKKIELLSRKIDGVIRTFNNVTDKINERAANMPAAEEPHFKSGGTGFLIDPRGYLVTNFHIIRNATVLEVQNGKGSYKARLIHQDPSSDLAVLKIEDSSFKPLGALPYGIRNGSADLGEDIFTLGFPRDDDAIVYGKGYMSARSGYEGDTLACQIAVAANPGNSGAPVLNNDGEIVGIINSSQKMAQGVVFAIRSKNIYRALDAMKADSTLKKDSTLSFPLRLPAGSSIKGLTRHQQISKIEDCVFLVKSN